MCYFASYSMYDCVLVDFTLIWDDIVIIDVCIGGLPWDAIGPEKRRGTIGSPESGLATRIALGSIFIGSPIARFMGITLGSSGADRTQVGPMLAPWTLLSGLSLPSVPLSNWIIMLLNKRCHPWPWNIHINEVCAFVFNKTTIHQCLFVHHTRLSSSRK